MKLGLAALLISLVVVAAGFGKSTPSMPTKWANGVCSGLSTWKASITSDVDSLKGGNITRDSVKKAADNAKNATDKLTNELKKLGKPNTSAGVQARKTVDQLATQVRSGVDTIATTVKNISSVRSALAAVGTVSATLKTLENDVSTAYKSLSSLHLGSELRKAFQSAPDCASFRKSG